MEEISNIVDAAFERHFGFPVSEVRDPQNLRHLSGDGIESYLYRGETFLYAQTCDIKVSETDGVVTASGGMIYREV